MIGCFKDVKKAETALKGGPFDGKLKTRRCKEQNDIENGLIVFVVNQMFTIPTQLRQNNES